MYMLLTGKHPFYKKEDKTDKYVRKMLNPTWPTRLTCSEYLSAPL